MRNVFPFLCCSDWLLCDRIVFFSYCYLSTLHLQAERASFQEQKVGYSKRLESFQDRQGIYRLEQVDDGREGFGDYDTISETANEG